MENILRLAAEHTFNLRYKLQFTWQTLFIGFGQTSAACCQVILNNWIQSNMRIR